jgi:hypothetical protein
VVRTVQQVLRGRDAGVRLEAAIAEATAVARSASIFAELRRHATELPVHRLRKATMVALSHAIEDECVAQAQRAYMFGAFQEVRQFQASGRRWREIARASAAAVVFADFDGIGRDHGILRVPLSPDAPMRREWAVICDGPDLAVALTAWELPGQSVPDRERVFEAMWTLEPSVVRRAARLFTEMASDAGLAEAGPLLEHLGNPVETHRRDPMAAERLFSRAVAYADRSNATR